MRIKGGPYMTQSMVQPVYDYPRRYTAKQLKTIYYSPFGNTWCAFFPKFHKCLIPQHHYREIKSWQNIMYLFFPRSRWCRVSSKTKHIPYPCAKHEFINQIDSKLIKKTLNRTSKTNNFRRLLFFLNDQANRFFLLQSYVVFTRKLITP